MMFWTPAFAGVTAKETFYELIFFGYLRKGPEGSAPRRGRRNFYGGPPNGSYTAQLSPDSPRRIEPTTKAAVAACEDPSRRLGGVDEAWVSFAAAPAGRIPLRASVPCDRMAQF